MRILMAALPLPMLACCLATAEAATISQYISGTISAVDSIDTAGAFSQPGTDLNGKRVRIYFQYSSQAFGPAIQCGQSQSCMLYFSKGLTGPADNLRNPNTPSSVLISIDLNGTRRTLAPFNQGTAEFYTVSSSHSPEQLYAAGLSSDSAALSASHGFPACQISVQYETPTAFAQPLSPTNKPVPDPVADYDEFSVSIPATAGSAAASTTLTFVPDQSAR